ncbi:hypothetical protein ACQ4PT_008107 [Festuca glaucescens]
MFRAMMAYSCSLAQGPRDDELLFTLDYAHGNWVEVLTPASCHGLTLLYDALAKAYYICNAATRAVTRLPHSAAVASHRISTGLGFDARTREHKVVRLINGAHRSREQDTIRFEQRLAPVFANGFLHWLIQPYLLFKRPRGAIVYFSVMEETFRCVQSPPFPSSDFGQNPPLAPPGFDLPFAPQAPPAGHLVEIDNQLCLVRDLRSNPHGSTLEIWRLLEYSSGDWSLDHRIDLSGHVMGRELCEPQTVRVIGSIDSGRSGKKIILTTCNHKFHEKFEKKVHTYDLSSQDLETILSVTEASTSAYGFIYDKPLPSRFGLFEDCLAPMNKTDEEIALSSTLSKAVKEILLRLPAKSVAQSKLICKQWLGLIKSESFMRSYFEHKNIGRRPKLMLVDEEIALSSTLSKVVKEILPRLPAKSVIQYSKLICKQWLWLIKSESFMQSYFEHKNRGKRPKLMLMGKGTEKSAFSFAPLDTWLHEPPSRCALLDTKVVCSKPCHGMNLVSTAKIDYLYNPGTGFHRIYRDPEPQMHLPLRTQRIYEAENHAFAVSNKNVGLTFDPLSREHTVVEIAYLQKNFYSREYRSVCTLRRCNSGELAREYTVLLPPLPVNDMPPAYVGGVLYWMSDPRLGRSYERAIVSFDISTRLFDTITCPSCITVWSKTSPRRAFAVELQGELCAVLADTVANSLDVWRLEFGRWDRACMIHLEAPPDYSLVKNVVVPLAADDPAKRRVQKLYSLDQVPLVASARHLGVCQGSHITSSGDDSMTFLKDQSIGEMNRLDSKTLPPVPLLYEDNLACYPHVSRARWLSFC